MITRLLLLSSFLTLPSLAAGCSSKDCVSLCDEAQAGDCTIIDGSCGAFCGALDSLEGDAGCSDRRAAYEDCLGAEANVCDTSCGSEENALSQCVGAYCLTRLDDPDCQTLLAAVQ
ncbi:MAG: hypothetical protein R3B72_08070 [Polyangiaceae bacterium]